MTKIVLLLALCSFFVLPGCTAAQTKAVRDGLHNASATALGIVTAAAQNPELVQSAKDAIKVAAEKATTAEHAAALNAALDHVNAGNLEKAQAVLTPVVAATAPAKSDADTTRAGQ